MADGVVDVGAAIAAAVCGVIAIAGVTTVMGVGAAVVDCDNDDDDDDER